MKQNLNNLVTELNKNKNPQKAKLLQGFFKTAPGQYGAGDIFLGLTVPKQREITKKYINLSLPEIQKLLNSKIHEHRFSALIILIKKYQLGDKKTKKQIYNFYLKNSGGINPVRSRLPQGGRSHSHKAKAASNGINNWDLIDNSAPKIVGEYLLNKNQDILIKLAKSKNLWQKRIAILSTFTFIREKDFKKSIEISKILLHDSHDLIHKAVGWMLREIGKRSPQTEKDFLNKYAKQMPRTMLRYSIEKFPKTEQKYFLNL